MTCQDLPREGRAWYDEEPVGSSTMLALVTDAFGGYGGIAQYNKDFLDAVAQSGLFRSILVLPRHSPLPYDDVPLQILQEQPVLGRLVYSLRALFRTVQSKPSVIFNGHLLHSPLSLILARLAGAKLISQLHGTEVWGPLNPVQRMALEASDLILTVSRDTRARTLDQLRIAPEKVVVLNNTFGETFTPGDRNAARRRFGVADEFVILTVARLDNRGGYKGHEHVIRLMPNLVAQGQSVTYLVAGTGPDAGRLAELTKELGLSDRVRFLGMVPTVDLPDLYRAADLFALPSNGEGFGIAFIEAMACGTPAIGFAIGGATDALADGALGICTTPDDFLRALIGALDSRDRGHDHLPGMVVERFGKRNYAKALAMQLKVLLDSGNNTLRPVVK